MISQVHKIQSDYGNINKRNTTYDEAYNQALSILDENEKETNFERDI